MAYEIYLKKGEEKRIVAGHSWVYANEVAKSKARTKTARLPRYFQVTEDL